MHALRSTLFVIAAVLTAAADAADDRLARRAFFGAAIERVDGAAGLRLKEVFAAGSAARTGLQAGDVVLDIDGRQLDDPSEFVRYIGQRRGGDEVRLRIARNGEALSKTVVLVELPHETMAAAALEYGQVTHPAGYALRTVVSVPDTAAEPTRRAAVLFLQGLGCTPIDAPLSAATDTFIRLIHAIGSDGFVTMRVDKPGVGDSAGPDCSEIGLDEELGAYRAALESLSVHPDVDPKRIHLIGFSMGGVFAPLLAGDANLDIGIASIAVYGTIATGFFEYSIQNHRRQLPRDMPDAREWGTSMSQLTRFWYPILFEGRTPADVWSADPSLKTELATSVADGTHVYGRHVKFFQQLERQNLPGAWLDANTSVLALHGEYDWVSSDDDHRFIADLAATHSPSRHIVLAGLDHGMTAHTSLKASYRNFAAGEWRSDVTDTLRRWLKNPCDVAVCSKGHG